MKLSRTKVLYLNESEDKTREYSVEFPDTGTMMDIELMKIQLSDNKYDSLKYSMNAMMHRQSVVIDAIATFVFMIPQLKKDLNVVSFLKLSYEQIDMVQEMYVEQFLPWYEEWLVLLSRPKEKPEQKKEA